MRRNQELKINYLSQVDDRDLLLKQIIYHKKQGQGLKTTYAVLKSKVVETVGTQEQNERMLDGKKMQEIDNKVDNQARVGTAPNINGFGRPSTAAMLKNAKAGARPFTGAASTAFGHKESGLRGFKSLPGGNRAISAGFIQNPKLVRYEDITIRLKKLLEQEKRNLRYVKTMVATEIETKNSLEKLLRTCVDDVKSEIAKKRSEKKSNYRKSCNF